MPRVVDGYARNPSGLRLYYRIVGEGPRTLVSGGACFLQEDLEPLAQTCRLVLYDRSGRGRSDPVPLDMPLAFDSEFADLEAVRTHLGIERFALMGWSYMGVVAGIYASDHPDAVERLLLCGAVAPNARASAHPERSSPELERERAESLRRRSERVDAEAVVRLEATHGDGLSRSEEEAFCREHRLLAGPRQFARRESMALTKADPCGLPNEWPARVGEFQRRLLGPLGETWDFRDRVREIRCPALAIQGLEDLVLPNAARLWGTLVRDARVLWVAHAGHFPWLERPDVFFPAVATFVAGTWPEGAERAEVAY